MTDKEFRELGIRYVEKSMNACQLSAGGTTATEVAVFACSLDDALFKEFKRRVYEVRREACKSRNRVAEDR